MKKFVLAMAVAFISATSFAQETTIKKVNFSIGAEGALPVGDYKDFYSIGLGATAQIEYMVAPSVGITGNAGYINFSGKNGIDAVGQIPVLAGARFYFVKDIYLSGQLGASFFTGNGSSSGFNYVPGIGVKFSKLDATLKYSGTSLDGATFSNIGLRVAYSF